MNTIDCPYCHEDAIIDDGFRCEECEREEDGNDAAEAYVNNILGLNRHTVEKDGGTWPIDHCPECSHEAYVEFDNLDNPNATTAAICFHCGYELKIKSGDGGATRCMKCNKLFDSIDGITVCDECFDQSVNKD